MCERERERERERENGQIVSMSRSCLRRDRIDRRGAGATGLEAGSVGDGAFSSLPLTRQGSQAARWLCGRASSSSTIASSSACFAELDVLALAQLSGDVVAILLGSCGMFFFELLTSFLQDKESGTGSSDENRAIACMQQCRQAGNQVFLTTNVNIAHWSLA